MAHVEGSLGSRTHSTYDANAGNESAFVDPDDPIRRDTFLPKPHDRVADSLESDDDGGDDIEEYVMDLRNHAPETNPYAAGAQQCPQDGDHDAEVEQYMLNLNNVCESLESGVVEVHAQQQALLHTAQRVSDETEFTRIVNKMVSERRREDGVLKQFFDVYLTAWMLLRKSVATRVFWPPTQQMLLMTLDMIYSLSDLTEEVCARKLMPLGVQPMQNFWMRSLAKQIALTMCGTFDTYETYIGKQAEIRAMPQLRLSLRKVVKAEKKTKKMSAKRAIKILDFGRTISMGTTLSGANNEVRAPHDLTVPPSDMQWSKTFRDELVFLFPPYDVTLGEFCIDTSDNHVESTHGTLPHQDPATMELTQYLLSSPKQLAEDAQLYTAETNQYFRALQLDPMQAQFFDGSQLSVLHTAGVHEIDNTCAIAPRTDETEVHMLDRVQRAMVHRLVETHQVPADQLEHAIQQLNRIAVILSPTPWEHAYTQFHIHTLSVPTTFKIASAARTPKNKHVHQFETEQAYHVEIMAHADMQHDNDFDPATRVSLGGFLMRFVYDWIHSLLSMPRSKMNVEASEPVHVLRDALDPPRSPASAPKKNHRPLQASTTTTTRVDDDHDDDYDARKAKIATLLRGDSFSRKKVVKPHLDADAHGPSSASSSKNPSKDASRSKRTAVRGVQVTGNNSKTRSHDTISSQWRHMLNKPDQGYTESQLHLLGDMHSYGIADREAMDLLAMAAEEQQAPNVHQSTVAEVIASQASQRHVSQNFGNTNFQGTYDGDQGDDSNSQEEYATFKHIVRRIDTRNESLKSGKGRGRTSAMSPGLVRGTMDDDTMVRRKVAKRKRHASADPSKTTDNAEEPHASLSASLDENNTNSVDAHHARTLPLLTRAEHARIVRFFNDPSMYHGKRPAAISALLHKAFPDTAELLTTLNDRSACSTDFLLPSLFALRDAYDNPVDHATFQDILAGRAHNGDESLEHIADTIRTFLEEGYIHNVEFFGAPNTAVPNDEPGGDSIMDQDFRMAAAYTATASCQFAQQLQTLASATSTRGNAEYMLRQVHLDFINRSIADAEYKIFVEDVYHQMGIPLQDLFMTTYSGNNASYDRHLHLDPTAVQANHELITMRANDTDNVMQLWSNFKKEMGEAVVAHLIQKRTRGSADDAQDDADGNGATATVGARTKSKRTSKASSSVGANAFTTTDAHTATGESTTLAAAIPDFVHADHYPTLYKVLKNIIRSDVRAHYMSEVKKKMQHVESLLPAAPSVRMDVSSSTDTPYAHALSSHISQGDLVIPTRVTQNATAPMPFLSQYTDTGLDGLEFNFSDAAPSQQYMPQHDASALAAMSQNSFHVDPPPPSNHLSANTHGSHPQPQWGAVEHSAVLDKVPDTSQTQGRFIAPDPKPTQRHDDNAPDADASMTEPASNTNAANQHTASVRNLIDYIDSQVEESDKRGRKAILVDLPDGSQTTLTLKPKQKPAKTNTLVSTQHEGDHDATVPIEQPEAVAEQNAEDACDDGQLSKPRRILSSEIGNIIFMAILITCRMVHYLAPETDHAHLLPSDRIFRQPLTDQGLDAFFKYYWPTLMEQIMIQVQYCRNTPALAKRKSRKSDTSTQTTTAPKKSALVEAHDKWELQVTPATKVAHTHASYDTERRGSAHTGKSATQRLNEHARTQMADASFSNLAHGMHLQRLRTNVYDDHGDEEVDAMDGSDRADSEMQHSDEE